MRKRVHVRTRQHRQDNYTIPTSYMLGIALILVAAGAGLALSGAQPFRSAEVDFADTTSSGLQILPASCDSPPPAAPGNLYGYQIPDGTNNVNVGDTQYNFCVTNSGGPTYFVPDNTTAEMGDFYNAANAGSLQGLTTSPN